LTNLQVYDDYCRSYRNKFREMPSFTVVLSADEKKILINAPEFIRLKGGSVTRIEITIDERIPAVTNNADMSLNYWYTSKENRNLMAVQKQNIDRNELRFLLPLLSPSMKGIYWFNMVFAVKDSDAQDSIRLRAEIV